MGDLFTVKVDLSTITRNEYERLYILLVDPSMMKMVYQFKMWVRFLFSIECSFKIVYDGAVIHDLEDINILKLLKTVQIDHADFATAEREQQELMAKLNRYNEWNESFTPAITPQKQCEFMNGNNSQASSSQFHDIRAQRSEKNELNLSNEIHERQEKHGRGHENVVQYSSYNGAQSVPSWKNSSKNKWRNKNGSFHESSIHQSDEYEMDFCNSNYNKYHTKVNFEKDNSIQNKRNNNMKETPKGIAECKASSETTKQESSTKKRSTHKPFSLYNFLETLRSEESSLDGNNKAKHDPEAGEFGNELTDEQVNEEMLKTEEEGDQLIKRKRKRIRKHKTQKSKVMPEAEFCKDASLYNARQKLKSLSTSPKPKHIRFDAEDNVDNREAIARIPTQDESDIVNGHTNFCHNSEPEQSNYQKFDTLTSISFSDPPNRTNTSVTAPVEIGKGPQENCNNGFEVKDVPMRSNDEQVDNGSLTNSSKTVLDVIGSLRTKNIIPPVFDRFATCT